MSHLENMAKVMLATGLIVAYGYMMEAFMAWYSGEPVRDVHDLEPHDRALLVHVLGAHPLQRGRAQHALDQEPPHQRAVLFFISLVVSVGMWLERFVIIVTSLHRDFLPSSWGMYSGTFCDWSAFIGTIGLFLTLLFLFVRFLPVISIFEMRTILPEAEVRGAEGMRGRARARPTSTG